MGNTVISPFINQFDLFTTVPSLCQTLSGPVPPIDAAKPRLRASSLPPAGWPPARPAPTPDAATSARRAPPTTRTTPSATSRSWWRCRWGAWSPALDVETKTWPYPLYHLLSRSCPRGTMNRLASTTLMRRLVSSFRALATAAVSRPAFQQFMNYSPGHGSDPSANADLAATRIAADPDTHQDFEPKSKSSDMSLHDIVAQDVKEKPVLIYMKGFPESPMCGFSALAVKVLQQYDVPISSRDILGDLKLKESVKAHTNWPTFPQIFIKGEFVGGSDIILSMHQKGELKDLLSDVPRKGGQSAGS